MNPDVGVLAQVLTVCGAFAAAMVALAWAVRRIFYPHLSRGKGRDAVASRLDDSRFAQLEQAVDSIAIEVERIAEAQRFTVKLLSERLPERGPERLPGSVSERQPR